MPGGKKVIASGHFLVKKVYFRGGMADDLFFSLACKIVQDFIARVYDFTRGRCHCHPKNKLLPPDCLTEQKLGGGSECLRLACPRKMQVNLTLLSFSLTQQ